MPDCSGFASLVSVSLHRPLNGTHALVEVLPWSGSVILSAHFPSPVCKSYGSFASALHRYGVCFASNEIDSFANELSTRQIEKKPSSKA